MVISSNEEYNEDMETNNEEGTKKKKQSNYAKKKQKKVPGSESKKRASDSPPKLIQDQYRDDSLMGEDNLDINDSLVKNFQVPSSDIPVKGTPPRVRKTMWKNLDMNTAWLVIARENIDLMVSG